MKIIKETRLYEFQFWAGAEENSKYLSIEQLNQIEDYLEEIYPEGVNETTINDIMWFETDWLGEILGVPWEVIVEGDR